MLSKIDLARLKNSDIKQLSAHIQLLTTRLERLSADSIWAHQASGIRGALLKQLVDINSGNEISFTKLKPLINSGFSILESVALEKISTRSKFQNNAKRSR